MRMLMAVVCGLVLATSVQAQDKKKEPTEKQKAQQSRMKDCNKQAGDKKMQGDARKTFMSTCLKG